MGVAILLLFVYWYPFDLQTAEGNYPPKINDRSIRRKV